MITYEMKSGWIPGDEENELISEAIGKVIEERESAKAGYFNLPDDSKMIVTEVNAYAASSELIANSDTIAVIGVGGASLGTQAIEGMLRHKYPNAKRMIFFENPDPIRLSEKFSMIRKEKTIFLIVSKSGTTIETMAMFKAVIGHFDLDLKNDDRERVIAITDDGSPLCRFADHFGLKTYTIPRNVKGRFSTLSAAGIVPLALAGYDTCSLLQGASKMVRRFFEGNEEHIALKAAFMATHNGSYPMNLLFGYSNAFFSFNRWYKQLWAESLGKIDRCGNRTGLTPMGQIGTVDQHSILQLIMQGPRDKTVTFMKVKDFENDMKIPKVSLEMLPGSNIVSGFTFGELINIECDTVCEMISKEEIPTDTITFDYLGEENAGEIIVYFQLLTSLIGNMLYIDTYEQPIDEPAERQIIEKLKQGKEIK
ncbi:glucose-6-phosphate isomerase [Hydrogenimonas sp.]